MPLTNCPDCNKIVSDMAASCPNCGYPIAWNVKSQGDTNNTTSMRSNTRQCRFCFAELTSYDGYCDECGMKQIMNEPEKIIIKKSITKKQKSRIHGVRYKEKTHRKNRLLGFRSNKLINKIVAVTYYIFVVLWFLSSISPDYDIYDYTTSDFVKRELLVIIKTLMFASPALFLSDTPIREKHFFFKKRKRVYTVIGFLFIFVLGLQLSRLISDSMSDGYKQSVKAYEASKTISEQKKDTKITGNKVQKKEEESTSRSNELPSKENVEYSTNQEMSEEEYKSLCEEIEYKDLMRTPEKYLGKKITIEVQIKQVINGGFFDDGKYYRAYTDDSGYGFYFDDEYYISDGRDEGSIKLLTDDIVKVYGRFSGLTTITRAIGWTKEEIPHITLIYAELMEEDKNDE